MKNRMIIHISLFAGCLITLTFILIMASNKVMAQNSQTIFTSNQDLYLPLIFRDYCYQYHQGDWIVTDYEAVEDCIITLMMEQGAHGLYQVFAEAGSSLVILNSSIEPVQISKHFAFVVQGAYFILENSSLVGMMHPSMETRGGGLSLINVSAAILDGNTISHHDSYGMWLTGSSNNTITNNTITCTGPDGTSGAIFLEYSHNNTITQNRLYRQWDALDIQQSWNNYIADNELTLTDHTIGISVWYGSGNNVITHNRISVYPGYEGRV
jgi:parallel beta-helix repeat protein